MPHPCHTRVFCFNPRSRVGSDMLIHFVSFISLVSIHAPAWGATSTTPIKLSAENSFNPRSRVGSDIFLSPQASCAASFNPRSRVGSDNSLEHLFRLKPKFQSTLPRGERRPMLFIETHAEAVSIHAPAWGATGFNDGTCEVDDVSIHAPAWGATFKGCGCHCADLVSIHAPAWGATTEGMSYFDKEAVSIHAPAWGATGKFKGISAEQKFQSTLPRGERLPLLLQRPVLEGFQSTLPRGERL